eukprot:5174864-Amphidinium_carterae.1
MGFDVRGRQEPTARKRPAIVGHRNYSPDLEPEEFYYAKLMLHTVWKEPGDWLHEHDRGSHAAAFQRIAADAATFPNFLTSICFPRMNGTVAAARELQKVQASPFPQIPTEHQKHHGCREVRRQLADHAGAG